MRPRLQIIITTFLTLYLATIILTDVSFVGFWTDIVLSISLSIIVLLLVYKRKFASHSLAGTLKILAIIDFIMMLGFLVINLNILFVSDTFKLRSFYYQKVNERLFHAYFKPVGSYSGGYGNFWITESPKYFPIIEWQVYYDRTVDYDFNDDNWDGQPTNNYEVVRNYIKSEVIDKKK